MQYITAFPTLLSRPYFPTEEIDRRRARYQVMYGLFEKDPHPQKKTNNKGYQKGLLFRHSKAMEENHQTYQLQKEHQKKANLR